MRYTYLVVELTGKETDAELQGLLTTYGYNGWRLVHLEKRRMIIERELDTRDFR